MENTTADKKAKCVAGCKKYTGGEIRHHKDCPFYQDSISRIFDNQVLLLSKSKQVISRLANSIMAHPDYKFGELGQENGEWNDFVNEALELLTQLEKEEI